jgi:hypothetical protein
MHWLDFFAKLAQMLSGIGIFLGAITAIITYKFYHQREQRNKWIDNLRLLYAEFWKDETVREVRTWITNDYLYNSKLKPILLERDKTGRWKNRLSPEKNDIVNIPRQSRGL